MAFPAARGLLPDIGQEPPRSSCRGDAQVHYSFVSFFHRDEAVSSPNSLGLMKHLERSTRRNRCCVHFSANKSTRMNVTHARRFSLFYPFKGLRK